jgi:hypothetical protein
MLRPIVLGVVALGSALVLAACGSNGASPTSTSTSSSASPTGSPTSSTSPTPAPTTPSPTPSYSFRFVGGGLERPDFQDVLGSDARGGVIVVAVRTKSETTGVDVSLAFSTDAGDTWAWGGTLQLPGEQVPQGIMITPQGAVVVGETRAGEADPKAFMATAAAPNFDLVAMTLPEEFAGAISLRDIALAQNQWVIVGLGRDDASFATLLWQSSDQGMSWNRSVIALPTVLAPSQLVVGPDGAWNIVGATQKSAAWARSEDGGVQWTYVQPDTFADSDDAFQFIVSANNVVGILGLQDAKVVLWVADAQGALMRMPLPDPSIRAIAFQGEQVVTAGSPANDRIDFWSLDAGVWDKAGSILGAPNGIFLDKLISDGSGVVVLGTTQSSESDRNIGIWKGALSPTP